MHTPSTRTATPLATTSTTATPVESEFPTWAFVGDVVDGDSQPISGAQVRLLYSESPGTAGTTLDWMTTDHTGTFSVRHERLRGGPTDSGYFQIALNSPALSLVHSE